MKMLARISITTAAALTAVAALGCSPAAASGGSGGGNGSGGSSGGGTASGTWPTAYPLPLDPGTVIAQSATTASVRSTDTVVTVRAKLDQLYLNGLGCAERLAVNKPKDYFCLNPDTGKVDEVWFTFAALDPTPDDPSRSQSNAFLVSG